MIYKFKVWVWLPMTTEVYLTALDDKDSIKIFDKSNISNPTLINPGDTVKFYKITKEEYINWNE